MTNPFSFIVYQTLSLFFIMMKRFQDTLTRSIFGKEIVTLKESFYQLKDKDMDGNEVSMSTFKGNVLLVVNVASKWGLTKQNYTELPLLIDEYGKKGFQVLAFPCNQFGNQEPGTHDDIKRFVDDFFPHEKATWFEKGHVNGSKTREVFSFLKRELPSKDGTSDVRWNFAKFLIDHEGTPYKRYSPQKAPLDIKDDIELLLKKKEGSGENLEWCTVKCRYIYNWFRCTLKFYFLLKKIEKIVWMTTRYRLLSLHCLTKKKLSKNIHFTDSFGIILFSEVTFIKVIFIILSFSIVS